MVFSGVHFFNDNGLYLHPTDAYIEDGLASSLIYFDMGVDVLYKNQALKLSEEEIANMVSISTSNCSYSIPNCFVD